MLKSPADSVYGGEQDDECYNFRQFDELIQHIERVSQASQIVAEESVMASSVGEAGFQYEYFRPTAKMNQVQLMPLHLKPVTNAQTTQCLKQRLLGAGKQKTKMAHDSKQSHFISSRAASTQHFQEDVVKNQQKKVSTQEKNF